MGGTIVDDFQTAFPNATMNLFFVEDRLSTLERVLANGITTEHKYTVSSGVNVNFTGLTANDERSVGNSKCNAGVNLQLLLVDYGYNTSEHRTRAQVHTDIAVISLEEFTSMIDRA